MFFLKAETEWTQKWPKCYSWIINKSTILLSKVRPTCNMQRMSTANRHSVSDLHMQNCCSHGPGGGSTCGGQDCQGGTVSHGGSTHQGGLKYNRNPHTQRFWNVSGGMHTVGGHHEFSSYGTPENIAVWRLSRKVHTCRDGYLQQRETKEKFFQVFSLDVIIHSDWH